MSITLELLGKEFSIESDASRDYVKKVGEYITSKFNELSGELGTRPPFDVAVLVALNIADELFQGREIVEQAVSILERALYESMRDEL